MAQEGRRPSRGHSAAEDRPGKAVYDLAGSPTRTAQPFFVHRRLGNPGECGGFVTRNCGLRAQDFPVIPTEQPKIDNVTVKRLVIPNQEERRSPEFASDPWKTKAKVKLRGP